MIKSKLTSRSQTTIPQPVRRALDLQPGDEVEYRIERDRVILRKTNSEPTNDPFPTFSEWDSDADREAYADL
jgi:antitoxin PrlF